MKRIIVDTSTGCLDYYNHPYDIRQLRIILFLGDNRYRDGLDLKADDFYAKLKANPDLVPATSQPSPGELLDFFEGLIAEGFDEAIVTTISRQFSGTFNGIQTVARLLEDKIKIYVYDTKTVCFPEGYFALEAAKLTERGKSVEEIFEHFDNLRKRVNLFFAVDSLKYLVKNGRLSGASGFVATMLKIKPLLEVQEDGRILAVEKIRTTRKALERVVEKFMEYVEGKKYTAYLVYTGNLELTELLRQLLKEKANIENLVEVPCTPIVGCHVGPDALGIGVVLDEEN